MLLGRMIGGVLLLHAAAVGVAFGQAPGWSRGQQTLPIAYEECLSRALGALQAQAYRIDYNAGNSIVGVKGIHMAIILCNPAPENQMAINIVVASNGEGGGLEREALQARMASPTSSPGDATGCSAGAYSISLDPIVVAPGEVVTARVVVPAGDLGSQWVGLFEPTGSSHLGQWSYLDQIRPDLVKVFTAPGPGQYEVRLMLDSGYEQIAVRCLFTVR